jgi:hypothetical protein
MGILDTAFAGAQARLTANIAADRRRAEQRESLLASPARLDKLVADTALRFAPTSKQPKYRKTALRTQAVDKAVPGGHPMKGYATELAARFRGVLKSGQFDDYSTSEILDTLATGMLVGEDRKGKSRLTGSYKHYREATARDPLNLFGALDRKGKLVEPPGYSQWRTQTHKKEVAKLKGESFFATDAEIAVAGGVGFGVGAVVGAVTGPAALPVAGITAASFMLAEMVAKPIQSVIHRTEWYRSNMHSDSIIDKVQAIGTDMATYVAAERGLNKAIGKVTAETFGALAKYDAGSILKKAGKVKVAKAGVKDADVAQVIEKKALEHWQYAEVIDPELEYQYKIAKTVLKERGVKALPAPVKALPSPKQSVNSMSYKPTGPVSPEESTKALMNLRYDEFIDKVFADPSGPGQGAMKALADQNALEYWQNANAYAKQIIAYAKSVSKVDAKSIYNMDAVSADITRRLARLNAGMKVKTPAELLEAEASLEAMWKSQFGPAETLPDFLKMQTPSIANVKGDLLRRSDGLPMYLQRQLPAMDIADNARKNNVLAFKMFGIGAGAILAFSAVEPKEVEAGMLGTAAKNLLKSGLIAEMVEEGQMILKPSNIQKGIKFATGTAGEYFAKNAGKYLNKKATTNMLYNKMSPYQVFNTVMQQGKGVMVNPAVLKASNFMAELTNTNNASRVLLNILDRSGIKSEYSKINKAVKPLLKLAGDEFEYNWRLANVKTIEKDVAKLLKRYAKGEVSVVEDELNVMRAELDSNASIIKRLKPSVASYYKQHDSIMQGLAKDSSSVRVSLALDGTEKYPWLNSMLTADDKAAAGRLRQLLDTYKTRFIDRGIPVIEKNYFPHKLHPEVLKQMRGVDDMRLDAHAFSKFYQRNNPNSRPLLPDIAETMRYYIRDSEARLQNLDFWKFGGWKQVMYSDLVQNNEGLREAFKALYNGTNPAIWGMGNKVAAHYANFEVWKRLFLSPSAGFKHALKVFATIATTSPEHILPAVYNSSKHLMRKSLDIPYIGKGLVAMGMKRSVQTKLVDDMFKSMIHTQNMRALIVDSSMEIPEATWKGIQRVTRKAQDIGSFFINTSEMFDRGVSLSAGLGMAAKRGMTPEQSAYGIYSYILNNNFLSREFNPLWLKNPKLRALFMFQSTVFKIWERRSVMAARTGRTYKAVFNGIKTEVNADNAGDVLKQLRNVRTWLKTGEQELKANLFIDALNAETDFFGTPIAHQFVKDIAVAGGLTYGAAVGADMALQHHFFHIPFLDTRDTQATLALNPAIQAGLRAWGQREANDDEFLFTTFLQHWLGSNAAVPITFNKFHRLQVDDIPDIYGDDKLSSLRYFLAIPTRHHGRD